MFPTDTPVDSTVGLTLPVAAGEIRFLEGPNSVDTLSATALGGVIALAIAEDVVTTFAMNVVGRPAICTEAMLLSCELLVISELAHKVDKEAGTLVTLIGIRCKHETGPPAFSALTTVPTKWFWRLPAAGGVVGRS